MCEIKVGPTRVWSCKIVIAWRNWHDLAGRKNAILTLKGTVFTCPLISRFRNSYYTAWHSPIFEKRLRMSVIWLIRDLYLVKILPLPSTGNYRRFFPVSTFGWDLRDSQACLTYSLNTGNIVCLELWTIVWLYTWKVNKERLEMRINIMEFVQHREHVREWMVGPSDGTLVGSSVNKSGITTSGKLSIQKPNS